MNYLEFFRLVAPEAQVVGAALVLLTLGLTRWRSAGRSTFLAALGLACAGGFLFYLPENAELFDGMLVISPLTSLFKFVCLGLALCTVLLAQGDHRSLRHHAEYLALVLLATVGLLLLVGSEELLMIFIGLELTGLSLYILTAFNKDDPQSAEAGLKYFLFGSTASAITLFGLSLIYGMCGTTGLAAISASLATQSASPLLAAGIVMTLIGFAFKIAAAPFHLWAPDTYQSAPISSAAFIASGSKVASFVVLGKIVLLGFAPWQGSAGWHLMLPGWAPLLAVLAALSIIIGNLAALAQKNVRRLLAYSAVAHAGYTLLGLIAAGSSGFSATLFYSTIYAIAVLGAFGVVGCVRRVTGGDDLAHFAGLARRSPVLAGAMAIFLLSLAGLPPLAGFFGKFYLFSAAFGAGENQALLWLVALALLGSLLSLYYYLLVLKAIFLDPAPVDRVDIAPHRLDEIVLCLLAAITIFCGVMPSVLLDPILSALHP